MPKICSKNSINTPLTQIIIVKVGCFKMDNNQNKQNQNKNDQNRNDQNKNNQNKNNQNKQSQNKNN